MKTGYVYKKANKANPSVPSILKKKVLPIALMIMLATQIVQPFFVAYADVNRNGLINNNNGPAKEQATDEEVIVDTWSDLEKLGTKQGDGDAYVIESVIEKNYTIKLKQDVVAASPIIIKGNVHVHISSNDNDNKTIYRQKGNTDFSVFTVDNGGTLTLGNRVTMSGQIAETYSKAFKITVTDAYGTVLYEETVYEDETRSPKAILQKAGYYTKEDALNLIENKTKGDPDSPYSLGYKLQETPWDMAGCDDTPMKEVNGDLLIVAKWDNPDPNKVLHVVDGYGNEIYRVEVPSQSSKTARELMHEAVINGTTYNIEDDNNDINTVLKMKLASVSDGPYALEFKFKEWNFGRLGTQPFSSHSGDFYVVAVWDNPDYVITLTDGYDAVLKTIDVAFNDNRTPLEILTELGINDNTQEGREAMMALIKSKTEDDPNSPYSLGYTLRTNPLPWEMSGFRDQSMSTDVRGNLLIKAMWVAPDKQLKLKVTDGAGNVIFESTDKSTTIQQLMIDKGLNANAANQSAAEKTAIANKVGSSVESPANDNDYSFNSWDFGGVDKTKTLTQIDGNVVVCATWNEPENATIWKEPETIDENTEIKIQADGFYMGVNNSNTTWEDDEDSESIVWVLKNVREENGKKTFEIHNQLLQEKILCVDVNASNRYTASPGDFRYNTSVIDSSRITNLLHYRFHFEKVGNQVFLACYDTFYHPQNPSYLKTVYLMGKDQQAIFFCDGTGHNVTAHAGVPTKKYPNPDTPGKIDVPGPGTPTGTPDQAGVTRANPVDKDDDDAAGRHNTATGETPQTTKTKQNAGRSQASGVDSLPINANSIKPALYRKDAYDTNQSPYRQKFASSNKGFFVKVNSGGTFDLQGATLHNFNTVSYNANMPTGVAPVYVDGGTLNMRSGRITNNSVSYSPTDGNNDGIEDRSGDFVNGGNRNTWSYVAPERNATAQPDPKPTKTAGAIIFTNNSKGSITGTASLDHNKADSGALIVQGDSIVVLGGIYNPNGEEGSTSNPIIDNSLGGGHIDSNVGFHYSGGALLEDGGTLIMAASDSTMNSNVSWNKGGAVWATEFGTHGDGYGVRKGGGVVHNLNTGRWLKPDGTPNPGKFIMLDGLMQYNTAFHRGGAINVESDYVILKGGEISYNNCRALGGAIYVEGDFADYNYTLKISEGYIGHNYAVNQNPDEQNRVIDNVGGYLDGKTLAEANDILDRKIVEDLTGYTGNNSANATWIANPSANTGYDSHSKPLSESSISDKTADQHVWTRYSAEASKQGNGGGLWLCPLGSTAVFNLNEDHEVYVDDNYASSWKATDDRPGTDIYLLPGDGHVIAKQMYGEIWINEKTGGKVPEENDSNIYSGHQGFKNVTTGENDSADHQYNQNKANVGGIKIVNNLSRDGGGIAANGTVIFGAPTDVFRHEAEMTLNKTWTKREIPHNITFKLFYMPENYQSDEDLIQLEGYEFTLTGSQTPEDEYSIIQESSSVVKNGNTIWSATFKIPTAVNIETVIDGVNTTIPYPLYKLIDPEDPSRLLSPSSQEDAQRIVELLLNGHNKLEIDQSSWRIVIKEFDANGEEITNSYFGDVWTEQFGKRDLHIGVTGSVGQELDQEGGYNIKFSLARFEQDVINTNETIEKYINNVVHEELYSYDEKFEYEIMAYVPIDATEVIIYDTLEDSLMFVTNTDVEQFDSDGNLNNAFQTERNKYRNFYMIKNDDNFKQLVIFDDNTHIGDESGTVAANIGFTVFSKDVPGGMGTNPMNAGNVIIGDAPVDPNNVEDLPAENISGNTLYIKIDENSSIAAVRGKWVRVKFYAAIKPQYRELNKIHNSENGWISKEESKQGEIDKTILGRLDKYLESNNETVTSLRTKNNRYYAKTSGGKFYQFCIDGDGQWWKTELAGGQTKYTSTSGQVRTTNNNTVYDDANKPLEGYFKTQGVFNEAPNQQPSWVGEDVDFNELRGGYNYPVIEAMEPHSGVKNQADYIVKRGHKPDSTYKSNIVTVDVVQPEKYVNGKVHDILGAHNEGYFDQMFEYTILVKVPEDAEEVLIYDTLRPDLMFVDYLGNTQYKAFSIGTNNNNSTVTSDVYNTNFTPNDSFNGYKNRMITNSAGVTLDSVGQAKDIYYLLVKDTNDHKGDGTGTASKKGRNDGVHLMDPVTGDNGSFIMVGDLVTNTDGSVSVNKNNKGNTLLIKVSKETLDAYDDAKTPIRGKWIQATFRAQIKPGSYPYIVQKLEKKETTLTTEKKLAVDYNPNNDTATIVAYKIKSHEYYYGDSEIVDVNTPRYYVENSLDNLTTDISLAADYNAITKEAKMFGYLYDDGNGEYTQIASRVEAIPVGRDYKAAYAKKSALKSVSNKDEYDRLNNITGVFFKNEDYDYLVYQQPDGVVGTDYLELYENKSWNDSEKWPENYSGPYNWEEVTDDRHIVNPSDLNSEGNHAGLANDAHYIPKFENEYHSMTTNTVTVEPKLRNLEITKKWIVGEYFVMPTMEEFKDYLHLWWEKTDENGQDSETDKLTGEITNVVTINEETFYKDHIEITYEDAPASSQETAGVRHYWKITIKNLPILRPSMKYFVTEDKIPGMNIPMYNNVNDTTTEHAHHEGGITNIEEDLEDETHVEVSKVWDVGKSVDKESSANDIKVQLMYVEEDGSKTPVYQRDDNGAIIYEQGNPLIVTRTLKGTDPSPWSYVFTKLPLYRLDNSGNKIQKTVNGKKVYFDQSGKEFSVDMTNGSVYDADGTTKLTDQQIVDRGIDVKTNGSVSVTNTASYVVANYAIDILQDPDGYILAYETETIINHHYTYSNRASDSIYFDESNDPLIVGYKYLNKNTGKHEIKPELLEGYTAEECTGLPATTDKVACKVYVKSDIEYPTYEIEIVNSKPEIEKYINKDVHLKTYFTNSFVYDILVYVPEEATEIEINDELMDTLVLQSFLEPEYGHENIVTGYKETSVSQINNKTIEMAVHATNNHTINGTVASKNTAGTASGIVNVNGNKFSIKINNIHYWGSDYIIDEVNGKYIKASNNQYYKVKGDDDTDYSYDSNNSSVLTNSLLKDGLTRIDNHFYSHIKTHSSYVEDESGNYILASDGNYYLEDATLPGGVDRVGTAKYSMVIKQGEYKRDDTNGTYVLASDNNYYLVGKVPNDLTVPDESIKYSFVSNDNLNLIGGRYVQVSFKATFNHEYDEQLKQWTGSILSPITPKPELDWDVIRTNDNQGWDTQIGKITKESYVDMDSGIIGSLLWQLGDKASTITKIVKNNIYYAAKGNDGKVYISPINPTKTQNINKWFYRIESNNQVLNLDGTVADVWEGNAYNYDNINSAINSGTNIKSEAIVVPIVEHERYLYIDEKYYLEDLALKYAPEASLTDTVKNTKYVKVDLGRGDGDVIRNSSSEYGTGNHAGIVNTASYEVTYGNRIKSTHKSNTVTVVPEIYELPSSGGIGTFLFNILGAMFITLALTEFISNRRKRKKSI